MKATRDFSMPTGLPPGTPIFVGEKKAEVVKTTVMTYNKEQIDTRVIQTVEECFNHSRESVFTWINVDGLHHAELLEQFGQYYELHVLTIEDILNTRQPPKVEVFDNYILLILKMYTFDEGSGEPLSEQISIVLGENVVLTFQEQEGDVFEPIRKRLTSNKSRIRKTGTDYLAYALLDAIVNGYFEILEKFGEQIEEIEEGLLDHPGKEVLETVHILRRELLFFRKSVWPLRNMLSEIKRQGTGLIEDSTAIYLRDLHDNIILVTDTIDTFRDMIRGILEIYLSSLSNRMNEIMRFLTILGTVFIPLTFIAGIYGMNFQFMPELAWRWGYFAVLFIMLGIGGTLLYYFKRKKWL